MYLYQTTIGPINIHSHNQDMQSAMYTNMLEILYQLKI